MSTRPSDATPAVKRKDPTQPPVKTASGEPPVKRPKRPPPTDATTEPVVINTSDTPVESVKHGKAASIPVRKQASRRKLAPSLEHAATSVKHMSVDDEHSPNELVQPSFQHSKDVHAQQKRKISKLEAELVEQRAFTE